MAPRFSESLRQNIPNPKSRLQLDLRRTLGVTADCFINRLSLSVTTCRFLNVRCPHHLPSLIWFERISALILTSLDLFLIYLNIKRLCFVKQKHINVINTDVNIISHASVNILGTNISFFLFVVALFASHFNMHMCLSFNLCLIYT